MFVLLALFSPLALAQVAGDAQPAAPAPLRLPQAVEEAQSRSPGVLKAEAEAKAASWRKLDALSDHLPHLSVNAERFFAAKYMVLNVLFGGNAIAFPTGFPQTTVAIDASWMVFDGFGAYERFRAAGDDADAADLMLSRARFEVAQEVRLRFDQVLAAQQLLGVSEQNIRSLEEHHGLALVMVKSGYSTRFDVLRIEAQLEEARAERLLDIDNVELARRALAEAMGEEPDARVVAGELPEPEPGAAAGATLDTAKREDLEAARRHDDAMDRLSSASSRFWVPKVSLFGQELFYQFGNFDPVILPTDTYKNSYAVGLRLSWNLFDGGGSYAKANVASYVSEADRQALRARMLRAPDEIETWKRRYLYNAALYEARKHTVEKSEESVRLAQIGLKAGTRTNSEFLDAELELFRARAGLVRAQADSDEARVRLELAVGHRL